MSQWGLPPHYLIKACAMWTLGVELGSSLCNQHFTDHTILSLLVLEPALDLSPPESIHSLRSL